MKNERIVQEFSRILRETAAGRAAALEREAEGTRWRRRFVPEDRLILLGGGHIALPLCNMAAMLDFAVTVVDDRPAFANTGRFPAAQRHRGELSRLHQAPRAEVLLDGVPAGVLIIGKNRAAARPFVEESPCVLLWRKRCLRLCRTCAWA